MILAAKAEIDTLLRRHVRRRRIVAHQSPRIRRLNQTPLCEIPAYILGNDNRYICRILEQIQVATLTTNFAEIAAAAKIAGTAGQGRR